jgi:molecular chaperone GrpE
MTNNPEEAAATPPPEEPKVISLSEAEYEKVKSEAADYKDKYLRQLAEMENLRKRLQKEKQEMTQFAISNVMADFLPPIDHMENALKFTQQMSEEVKHWGLGFQMILTQFKDVLSNNGVQAFTAQGAPFDPHCHEAIETVETKDVPPGTVVEECVRGYKMGDKIIRPASVKVAKEPTEKQN